MVFYDKDPDEVRWLGFTWDVAPHTLTGSVWVVPEGIVATDASYTGTEGIFDPDTSETQLKVSGGTAGQVYHLVNRVSTSNGETFDDTLIVLMKES